MLDRIQSMDARAAADRVIEGLTSTGFEVRPPRRGHVRSINFWRDRSYAFSFIPNRGDILFYCRNPATKQRPKIEQLAREHHSGDVNTNQLGRLAENKKRETKIRLRTRKDAERMLAWLLPEAKFIR